MLRLGPNVREVIVATSG